MRRNVLRGWMRHIDFIILDIFSLQLAYALGVWIIHGLTNPYATSSYLFLAIHLFFSQVIMIPFVGGYDMIVRRGWGAELLVILRYLGGILLTTMVILFAMHNTEIVSRLLTGTSSVLFIGIDLALRQLNKKWILSNNFKEADRSMFLITSSGQVRKAFTRLFAKNTVHHFKIVGIVLMDQADPEEFADLGIPIKHLSQEAIEYICHAHVDEVFILQPDNMLFPKKFIDTMMEMGIIINYSNTMLEWFSEIRRLGQYDVLTTSVHAVSAPELVAKRLFDIFAGILGCLATGIIFIFIAPIIYAKSPGPIFFAQERIGRNGKTFKMYKFRSMYMDAEKRKAELMAKNSIQDGMMFKIEDDPRIIGSEKKDKNGKPKGIGNFIRNTSLDEFPQFFNVLKGDMSLVGTRPPTLDEWKKYENRHRIRMSAKPGITGMWQVSGRSSITDFEQVVALDRYYIENWSLGLDIKIIAKTILIVLKRDGAF